MHVRGNGVSDKKKMMPILGICMWGNHKISVLDWFCSPREDVYIYSFFWFMISVGAEIMI